MKILLLVFIVFMIGLAVIRYQGNEYKAFLAKAQQVQGAITHLEERDSGQKNRRKEHVLHYRYEVEGVTYNAQSNVEYDDLWSAAKKGMALRVAYDPADPQKSYPSALIERRIGIHDKVGY